MHYYQWDDHDEDAGNELHDNIKPTIYRGVSGQTNQEGDYPTLNQLKRIKVAKNDGTLTVVSWYLSDYTKDRLINGGIVHNMFTHDLGGDNINIMTSISKQWRAKQFSTRHRHIQEFCSVVFNDPDYDLTKVTKTLRNLPITDINRDNMYKIINRGLYIGKVAHDYQREKKGVGIGSPILVPSYCIYTAHSYDSSYTPSKPKPTGMHDLTYDFAFDDSQIAIVLWTECKYIAESIGIDINMTHWFDIFHKLDIQYNKVSLTIHDLIELSLIIQTITCIYNTYKTLTDDFHNGKVTDFMIDHVTDVAISQFHKKVTSIILLTPAMQRFLGVNSTVTTDKKAYARYTEREKAHIPHIYLNPNKLTCEQADVFSSTWCMSNFVEITNTKLVLKPIRREPP